MKPLYDRISAVGNKNKTRYCMPGHVGKAVGSFADGILKYDLTELPDTDNLWRCDDVIAQAEALAAQQKLLLTHCRSEYSRLMELEAATARQEQLFTLGETKLLELAEARHLAYERKIAYLDCLVNLLETQTKLQYLNPFYNQQ